MKSRGSMWDCELVLSPLFFVFVIWDYSICKMEEFPRVHFILGTNPCRLCPMYSLHINPVPNTELCMHCLWRNLKHFLKAQNQPCISQCRCLTQTCLFKCIGPVHALKRVTNSLVVDLGVSSIPLCTKKISGLSIVYFKNISFVEMLYQDPDKSNVIC